MIPIFSILCVFSVIANFFCFLWLHLAYRKTKQELTDKFSKVFLFTTLFWFFPALPRLVINDLRLIQISLDIGLFFAYVAMVYILFLPFQVYYHKNPPRYLFVAIIGLGVILLLFNFFGGKLAFIHHRGNFVFWSENRNPLINVISGFLSGVAAIVGGIFFLVEGLKNQDKEIRLRSFLISSAIFFTILGSGIRLIFGSLIDIFFSTLIGLLFGMASAVFMILAFVFVKPKPERIQEKLTKSPITGAETIRQGEIFNKDGLTVVKLRGSHYEMGFQHGKIFEKEIRRIQSSAKKIVYDEEGEIIGRIAFPIIRQMAKKLEKQIPEQFREEMRGIADGSSVDYNFILLENLIEELVAVYNWYFRPRIPLFLRCSCFVKKEPEGIVWGRNLDYQFFTEHLPSLSIIFVYLPDEGYPFVSLGWPGNIGAATGISQNLGVILLSSPTKERTWKGIAEEVLTRQIIQYGHNIATASESIIPGIVVVGQNLVLVSEDEAQVIELSLSKKAIRSLGSQGCLTATNHFQSPEMKDEQVALFSKPNKTVIPDEFFTLAGSKAREEKLRKLCLAQHIDKKRATEILDQVSTPGTVQSVICFPARKEFWIARRSQPPVTKGEWMNFRLEDLLS